MKKNLLITACACMALICSGCTINTMHNPAQNNSTTEDDNFEIPNPNHPFRTEYPTFTSQLDYYIRTFFTYQNDYTATIIDNDIHCRITLYIPSQGSGSNGTMMLTIAEEVGDYERRTQIAQAISSIYGNTAYTDIVGWSSFGDINVQITIINQSESESE